MSQETRIERFTANISRRITGSHELNAFQTDPLSIRSSPETMLFSELTKESDDSHGTILISIRKVDFITEDNQPLAGLFGTKHNATDGLVVLAIMLELLHDEARVG